MSIRLCDRGATKLSGRSTAAVEREAVEWAAVGARTLADVSDARGLLSEEAFQRKFPSLETGTYREILAEVPDAWKDLMRGTATAQHAGAREKTEHTRGLVMGTPKTLAKGPETPVAGLRVRDVYRRIVAARWSMPSAFRAGERPGEGREIWAQKGREEQGYLEDVRDVYVGTRHKAVPQFMCDRAYKVATRTDFSNRKFRGSTMPAWKCPRCGQEDSTAHKYSTCVEVKKAWGHTFGAWERLTDYA